MAHKGTNMNLSDFQAMASRRTGLVAMVTKRSFAPYYKGQVAGFPPETALAHHLAGDAEVYEPGSNPVVEKPKPRVAKRPPPALEGGAAHPGDPKDPAIPADWESMHYLKKIALARHLASDFGTEGEEKATDAAERVIRAEVARRETEKAAV